MDHLPFKPGSLVATNSGLMTAGQPSFDTAPPALDVAKLYSVVRRNIGIIAGVAIVAVLAALLITLLTTPQYKATASVQIDQESDRILNTQQVRPSDSYQDADRFLQTEIDVLRSQVMATKVAQTLGLFNNPTFFASMKIKMPIIPAGPRHDQLVRDAVLTILKKNMDVTLPRQSRVVALSFVSADPQLAASIANAYARSFIDYNLQRKYDSSSYARDFLSRQLVQVKSRLEGSERDLNNYSRQFGLIKTDAPAQVVGQPGGAARSGSVTVASLVQLNEAANAARGARIAAEQKWRSSAAAPAMNIPEVFANPAVQGLLQQRADKTAQLHEELALHREGYPTVVNLTAQVKELNQQIDTIANGIKKSLHDAFRIAADQEQALNGQVSSLKTATLAEQDRSVRYNILSREADTNRTLYDGLLQRFKEISAEAGITTNNISLVDAAEPPSSPASPRLIINLAIGLVLGLLVAGIVVFVREQLDDAVRAPEDVERKLGLRLLGVIPLAGTDENLVDLLNSPRSKVAEAYHALRTSLLYSSASGLPKTILVTSTQAGEGKSTTSFAIALDLARIGKRVVLIDVDLRRPSLHRVVNVDNAVGMSSLLTHYAELDEVITSGVMPFDMISSGPIPPSPTELLTSGAMSETIHRLSTLYDVVIVDGPPVLGLADAPILSAQVEATLLVIEANRGHRGATKTALRRLDSGDGQILGAVLTKFDPSKTHHSSSYGYQYDYYGEQENRPTAIKHNPGS